MTPRRNDILRALGIQAYAPRASAASGGAARAPATPEVAAAPPAPARPPMDRRPMADAARPARAPVAAAVEQPSPGPSQVGDKQARPAALVGEAGGKAAPTGPLAPEALDWDELRAAVAGCRQCSLCESRTQTVFGVGDRQADWLVVGEAPGADEDRKGEPFVGRAGQLLNAMLNATGRQRGQVYIANILKCRPPSNRDPHNDEAAACRPFLDRQIELLQPRIILAVGRIAAQRLLGVDTALGRLRGQVHSYGGAKPVPLVVTYHPAYLLRSPAHKRQAWEDLLFAQRVAASTVH